MFKAGDIVISKEDGTVGVIVPDPKYPEKLVVRIHPFIFGQIIEDDWELLIPSQD